MNTKSLYWGSDNTTDESPTHDFEFDALQCRFP